MIRVEHLHKSFGQQKVLVDVCLDVKEGEIIAVLGQSGVGKSVLLKHIVGLLRPDQGRVMVEGRDLSTLKEKELLNLRRKMGYLFQESALYDFMNVGENISFPLREHTRMKSADILKKVRQTLQMLDLEGIERKFPSELSGGMKKRVGLARAIILDSKCLLCDEPTSGLDPIRSRDISDMIKRVVNEIHCTTIITSHDLPNSFRIADRVALIHEGRFVALGTPDEVRAIKDPFVQEFLR